MGPQNEVLSIAPGDFVQGVLGLMPGDDYVCVGMHVEPGNYYTVRFYVHKPIESEP